MKGFEAYQQAFNINVPENFSARFDWKNLKKPLRSNESESLRILDSAYHLFAAYLLSDCLACAWARRRARNGGS